MSFDGFIGNSRVVERLRAKLREDRFPHGLIFSGPEGVGKRTCALMLAKALNCAAAGPVDFCGQCAHCRKIDAGAHPDVTLVTVEEEASEIKIAQIRRLLQMLDLHPLEGASKIYIIDPANQMKPSAANALLKGLEEPPDNSFFFLLTANVHELLMTVRSRSQVYHFSPLTFDEMRRQGVSDELVVRWSQGSIGRARSLDPAVLVRQREMVLGFLETAINADETEFRDVIASSGNISRSKNDFPAHLTVLTVVLEDLLYLNAGMAERMINVDIRARLEKLVETTGVERLIAVADFVREIETSLKGYVNRAMMTDVLALTANAAAEKILNDNHGKSR